MKLASVSLFQHFCWPRMSYHYHLLILLRLISLFGFQGTACAFALCIIIQAFCLDSALAIFDCSFLSRFKCVFLRSEIPVSKLTDFFACKTRLNGDGEIRTLDPLLARQVLSQLSYAPISKASLAAPPMGLSGLEPPTSRLSGVRSNLLSYKPFFNLAATYSPTSSPMQYHRPLKS